MATGNKIKVSVEKAIHSALTELLQKIWDEHKVCVKDIEASWIDVSTPGHPKFLLHTLELKTKTVRG